MRKALSKDDFKNKLNSCADRLSEYKEKGEEIMESGTTDMAILALAGNTNYASGNEY